MKAVDTTFMIDILRNDKNALLKSMEFEVLLNKLTVLPLDHKAAIKAGQISGDLIKKGRMIDDIDCLTAGIILTNGCDTIITRNAKDFNRLEGLKVEGYCV